jgi:hypothetical protein
MVAIQALEKEWQKSVEASLRSLGKNYSHSMVAGGLLVTS